jgi:cell division septum initiation protein DivIVA
LNIELTKYEVAVLLDFIEHEKNYTGLSEGEEKLEEKLKELYRKLGGYVK